MSGLVAPSGQIGLLVHIVKDVPATYDSTGFAALTWSAKWTGCEMWPPRTAAPEDGRVTEIEAGDSQPFNGAINRGIDQVPFNFYDGDTGQGIVIAGRNGQGTADIHSIRLTHNNGDIEYFTCIFGDVAPNAIETGSPRGYIAEVKRLADAVLA